MPVTPPPPPPLIPMNYINTSAAIYYIFYLYFLTSEVHYWFDVFWSTININVDILKSCFLIIPILIFAPLMKITNHVPLLIQLLDTYFFSTLANITPIIPSSLTNTICSMQWDISAWYPISDEINTLPFSKTVLGLWIPPPYLTPSSK